MAPLKKLTIPRLEIMGAILAIRLTETLMMELNTPIHRIIIWSDSAIVLQWIKKSSSGYHAFVGNRINEIDDGLTPVAFVRSYRTKKFISGTFPLTLILQMMLQKTSPSDGR